MSSVPSSIHSSKMESVGCGLRFLLFQRTFTAPPWLRYSWVFRDEVVCLSIPLVNEYIHYFLLSYSTV